MNKYRNTILLLSALCICMLGACSKSNNASQPRTLNQIETQLLGTWYIYKQIDSQLYYNGSILSTDTTKTYYKTYNNFTSGNYITFKSDAYNSQTAAIGNLGLQCIDNSYGLSSNGSASATGTADSVYWFYDETDLMQLQINKYAFYVIKLTNDTLVLRYSDQFVPGLVKYNYNWCYLYR